MKVCVFGLWHLGTVTAACLASIEHQVIGLDVDPDRVAALANGTPPVFEPGLEELVKNGLATGNLAFTTDVGGATREADVVWIAFDTPVDEDDRADVDAVVECVRRILPFLRNGALVLISSQVPVGTTSRLERMFAGEANGRTVSFAYSPENLRLGKALDVFTHPDRIVVGVRSDGDRSKVTELLCSFTDQFEWMSVESAEMTKHALNAFLAMSVAFINEVAAVCEQVGANASEVERGLKTEERIGPRAYLSPGAAFAGGTLARDVMFLSELGASHGVPVHLLSSVKTSNDRHRDWARRRLEQVLGAMSGRTVAIWGLTYKPGTDTLRRSSAIELCEWLHSEGAVVHAHDPVVKRLPPEVGVRVCLFDDPLSATDGASALVVATPWPEYRQVDVESVRARMARALVLDAGRFLASTMGRNATIEYLSVGGAR